MFIAAATGLLLAKVRTWAILLHVLGLAVGFVFVTWAASSLVETGSFVDKVPEMWRRLREWYDAATSGGISRDLLPFSLMLMTMGWLLAYFSSWFIFRSRNVWIPVVLAGTAVLTNLSFLPGQYAYWFFLFTGAGHAAGRPYGRAQVSRHVETPRREIQPEQRLGDDGLGRRDSPCRADHRGGGTGLFARREEAGPYLERGSSAADRH